MDWKNFTIRDVTSKSKNRDPRKEARLTFKYVDVSSVSNSLYKIVSVQDVLKNEAPSRARKDISENDIIFATVRPTLKRIALIPDWLDGEIASTGYCVLRPNTNLVSSTL